MASTLDFLDYILDQITDIDIIRTRKMFGEYSLYYDNRVVALICDNQFYLKNTKKGQELIGKDNLRLASPFPKAKDWILLDEEIENRELFNELLLITRGEL